MATDKVPKTTGEKRKNTVDKMAVNEEEIEKIDCVEGEQAFDNFVNLTRQLLSVPKSQIVEMERSRKKKS